MINGHFGSSRNQLTFLLVIVFIGGMILAGWWIATGDVTGSDLLLWAVSLLGFMLIINNPVWGIAILIGLEPVITIFPRVEILSSVSPLVGGMLVISYVLRLIRRRATTKSMGTIFGYLVIWFVTSVLIGIYGFNIPPSRNWLLTYIQLIIMIWVILQVIESEKDIVLIMKVILGIVFTNSVFGLAQLIAQLGLISTNLFRISGLTGNANEFAIYSVLGVLFSLYFLKSAGHLSRLALLVILSVCLSAVLFSGSRGGLIFTGITVLYAFAYKEKFNIRKSGSLLLVAAVFIGMWQFLPGTLQIRFAEMPQAILYGEDTVGIRYQAWSAALKLWLGSPLFGIGLGGFQYYNRALGLVESHSFIVAHNMYITVLTEQGLFGFLPFFMILVLTVRNYLRAEKDSLGRTHLYGLVIVWQAVLLLLLLAGLKGSIQYTKILWWAIGIGLALPAVCLCQSSEPMPERNSKK